MKITMYIIKDFLGKDVLSGQIHTGRSAGIVESVAVFDPELDTSPEYAYLVERRHASLFAGREYQGAFLFLGGKEAEIPQGLKNDCLVLRGKRVIPVLQKLQQLFEHYQKWELELYRAAVGGRGIREIAMTAAELIENPFFLYTATMKLIFSCNLTEKAENRFRASRYYRTQEEGTYVNDCFLEKIKNDPERAEAMKEAGPKLVSDSDLGYRTLAYNIMTEGVCKARLVACETERPLSDGDFFVLRTLGDFLVPFLEEEDMTVNAHSVVFDRCMRKLLEGRRVEESQLQAALEAFGWNSGDRYCCAYLPSGPEMSDKNLLAPICFHLEVTCPNSAAILFDDYIVHILNLSATGAGTENVRRALARMYREKQMSAGISQEFSGIRGAADRCRQAKAACDLGTGAGRTEGCFLYEDYVMEDLLRIYADSYSPETVRPEEVKALMEYDRNHRAQLTGILKTYLQNDRNASRSARALGMQRSRFLYQIQRVQKVAKLDLEDYRTCLFLQFYFAVETDAAG